MDSSFSGVSFEDASRAQANLALVKARVPASVYETLPTLLPALPDPDSALNYFERFTAAAPRTVLDYLARNPVSLHYLLTLFSYSRFLSETLVQQPELITWLHRPPGRSDLARVKSKEDLLQEYARFEATAIETDRAVVLARFKRREYLRITLKDVLGMATLAETTIELSTLADVLLEKARALAEQELTNRYGQPTHVDASGRIVPARFAVLSLGKLGGSELNYSSDIDLLYLYSGEGETSGGDKPDSRISNTEFFLRLAHAITRLIGAVTREGAVFRVDLRLRPQGSEGDLAVSLAAALDYYRRRADDWERQMLIKARYSAGDATLAREFLRAVQPLIYETAADFQAIESIRDSRERIDRKLSARLAGIDVGRGLNLKLAPGGIRDIEFLVQCLQRLYGGTDPWVRTGGTLVALTKLFDKGHLHQRDYFRLSSAYQLFRKVEHRLQLVMGQQTHSLPENPGELERLARRAGVGPTAGLNAAEYFRKLIARQLADVREIHDRVIHTSAAAMGAAREEFALTTTLGGLPAPAGGSLAALLNDLRLSHPELYAVVLESKPAGRGEKAFSRFLSAALSSSWRFEVLEEHSEVLPLARRIFETSDYLAEILIRNPEAIAVLKEISGSSEPVGQLQIPLPETPTRRLDGTLAHIARGGSTLAARMADLRKYFQRQQFLEGAREIAQPQDVFCSLAAYSRLAKAILHTAFEIAREDVRSASESLPAGRFAILALGRLGMNEMDIGSDADLVFVCDEPAVASMPLWKRLAERLIQIVSSYTREGTIFPVDARLRPGGGEGELVQTLDYLTDYFSTRAEAWEATTYLKLRPVAGDAELGPEVVRRLGAILGRRFREDASVGTELARMRLRLETESQPAGVEDNFKTGAGGLYDVDYLLSFLQLRSTSGVELGRGTREQIDSGVTAGGLGAEQAGAMREAVRFLRSLDHAIRLVTGRATSALPERAHWEPIATLVSASGGRAISAAELPPALKETRATVRKLYEQVFQVPKPAAEIT